MTNSNHVLVYIKRNVGEGHGKPQTYAEATAAAERPIAHCFGQEWLSKLAQSGQPLTIWLFSVVRHQQWCLPPSLDACIHVGRLYREVDKASAPPYIAGLLGKFKFALEATPESCYFPWNDFSPVLQQILDLKNWPPTETNLLRFSDFVVPLQSFQSPRKLNDASVQKLLAFAQHLKNMPTEFISYRRAEGAIQAMEAAAFMYADGIAPWWDQWAMPRKIAEERAICDSGILEHLILEAINKAKLAISIHTPSYASDTAHWTKLELEWIIQASKCRGLIHCQINPVAVTETQQN